MPISGTFLADFESFYAASQKAVVSLASFESGGAKVEKQLNRAADAFSGKKIIQDATLMAQAFEQLAKEGIGLTSSELQRMGAVASEAAAKLTAMGKDVPPGIQRIADAAKNATGATGGFMSQLGSASSLLGAFGVSLSVGGLVAFGKSVLDTGSQIHDVSQKLGISAKAVQGFGYAASQGGASLDTVGSAITKMNVSLSEGGTGTIQALRDAGLSFDAIRAMRPEDAFLAITDALEQIPDPMTRSRVAAELFGKAATDLLPAIVSGFRRTSDGVKKMSDDTVDKLADAQAAWTQFGNTATRVSGTAIAATITAEQATSKGFRSMFASVYEFLGILDKLPAAVKKIPQDIHLPTPVTPDYVAQLKAAETAFAGLTVAQRANLRAAIDTGTSTADIAKGLKVTEELVTVAKNAWTEEAAAHTKATAEIKKNQEERNKGFAQSAALQTKLIDDILANQRRAGATANELRKIELTNQMNAEIAAARTNTKATQGEIDTSVALIKIKYKGLADDIGLDYQLISRASLKSAEEQRDDALKTHTYMVLHADQFTRGAIQTQLEKYRELRDAATAQGRAMADGQKAAADATQRTNDKLANQQRLVDEIAAQEAKNLAIRESGQLYTVDENGNPTRAGNTITGAVATGTVTPVSAGQSSDPAYLQREIAKLTQQTAAYVDPSNAPTTDANAIRTRMAIIQRQLDAMKQLEYLEKLLALARDRAIGGSGSTGSDTRSSSAPGEAGSSRAGGIARRGVGGGVTIHNTTYISGVFDPSARQVLSGAVSDGLMRGVANGRLG